MCVCGESELVTGAAAQIEHVRPDVVLVDLNLRDGSGLELLQHAKENWIGMRTVVVSQHDPKLFTRRTRQAGAWGYVCKDDPPHHIVEAIRAVSQGHECFDYDQ